MQFYKLCTHWKVAAGVLVFLMAGCSSTSKHSGNYSTGAQNLPPANSGRGGYYKDDGPGDRTPQGLSNTPDAQPRAEPISPRANRPYSVFGKTYTPITDSSPYKRRGIGSWYGKKFHGNKTSSGEIYDMYKMTAAHPTLPIPSYARVTNLDNGRQVIVRINDRGPFHGNRLIDLSYTAALKLGYLGKGSGMLEVERLLPGDINDMAQTKRAPEISSSQPTPSLAGYYLQLGSFTQADNAEAQRIRYAHVGTNIDVVRGGMYYRLMAGPYATREKAADAASKFSGVGSKPIIVQR